MSRKMNRTSWYISGILIFGNLAATVLCLTLWRMSKTAHVFLSIQTLTMYLFWIAVTPHHGRLDWELGENMPEDAT